MTFSRQSPFGTETIGDSVLVDDADTVVKEAFKVQDERRRVIVKEKEMYIVTQETREVRGKEDFYSLSKQ